MALVKALVDKLLSGVSSRLDPEGHICDEALPTVEVMQQSGKIGKYGKGHLRIVNTAMGGRGKAPYIESVTRDSDAYYIDDHGLESMVTANDYRNVEDPFDAESDETESLTSLLIVSKEHGLATAMTNTAIMTQNETLVGGAQFSDLLNSDPLKKFREARAAVKAGCGMTANRVIMPWEVFLVLQTHPQILDALGYKNNRAGQLTAAELANVLEVQKLHIPQASYNSAKEGQADVLSPLWGKHMIFYRAPEKAQKKSVSLGFNVKYKGQQIRQVYKKSDGINPPQATQIVVVDSYDQLIKDPTCGFLIKDAVA